MQNALTIEEITKICEGQLFCGDKSIICNIFTKDTRTIKEGDTYIGIKGDNFDGNLFYKEAFSKGANAVILEKSSFIKEENYSYNKPIILVDSAKVALKKLGEYKRNTSSACFVGITGSVGKTSTRDMIYSVLNREYKTLKTEGNYNNNIGLPLTLLRLTNEEAAVIEMGMNALGEIDYLTKIARPHISVITNVGTAHIGELGSRENILKAKLEIKNGMDEEGILVINNDNDLLHEYSKNNLKNIITIGIDNESNYQAKNIKLLQNSSLFTIVYEGKEEEIYCPAPGKVFVYNSLVAFAVGTLLKMTPEKIKQGISSFQMTKNRLETFEIKEGITIINDAYNASVDSMKSSLEILKNKKATRKIAVLGDMLELGDFSEALHREVGKCIYENEINILIVVGEDAKCIAEEAIKSGMKEENIKHFGTNKDVVDFLLKNLRKDDAVLLKASNGMHFMEIAESLKKWQ